MTVTVRQISATFPDIWKGKGDEMAAILASLFNSIADLSQIDQQLMLVILIGTMLESYNEEGVDEFIDEFSEVLRAYTNKRRGEKGAHVHATSTARN